MITLIFLLLDLRGGFFLPCDDLYRDVDASILCYRLRERMEWPLPFYSLFSLNRPSLFSCLLEMLKDAKPFVFCLPCHACSSVYTVSLIASVVLLCQKEV